MKAEKLIEDERGSVATVFAVLLPCLLGFAGLGIEVGFWFSERQGLQIASDSAAYSALVAHSVGISTANAIALGKAEAHASGFAGADEAISIAIHPASGATSAYSTASIEGTAPLFFTRLFMRGDIVHIGVQSFAAMDATGPGSCILALDPHQSRSILVAAGVSVAAQGCVVSSNATPNDAIWLEGSSRLSTDCITTPGGVSWNGSAALTLRQCSQASYPRETQADPYAAAPFWGAPGVPSPTYFADAAISQGRYGQGMPGGTALHPGKYGKQVEIAGDVRLDPGVYYFTNGFRATQGAKITGQGVTLYFDQTKVLDVAQSVGWNVTAPTSGPTQGIALMGDPSKTAFTDVRLIGVLGNVQGAIYFPNQRVLTESGPNLQTSYCTTLVGRTIDIRGSGTITNNCSGSNQAAGGGKVRLVAGVPA